MNRAITSSFHKPINAGPDKTYAVLRRFESRARLDEALMAMGVEDRVISSHRIGLTPRRASGYSLVWRLGNGGRAEIVWSALVRHATEGGSLLSIRVRAFADDANSRAGLLAAWPVLGPLAEHHAKRTIHAVKEFAERFPEEDHSHEAPALLEARAA
ncbi:MAG TPA: hypothetical protein VGF74_14045 [Thermoleophilaceae bacterium]|jgi:hypothetical protein